MPFVMRGDSHIALPLLVPFHMPMVLEFDVRIDDTLHDHVFFGDDDGVLQYRYTRGQRHLIDWQGQEARLGYAANMSIGQWHHVELGWVDNTGVVVIDHEPLSSISMPQLPIGERTPEGRSYRQVRAPTGKELFGLVDRAAGLARVRVVAERQGSERVASARQIPKAVLGRDLDHFLGPLL